MNTKTKLNTEKRGRQQAEVVTEPDTTLTLSRDLAREVLDEDQIDLHINELGGVEVIAAK